MGRLYEPIPSHPQRKNTRFSAQRPNCASSHTLVYYNSSHASDIIVIRDTYLSRPKLGNQAFPVPSINFKSLFHVVLLSLLKCKKDCRKRLPMAFELLKKALNTHWGFRVFTGHINFLQANRTPPRSNKGQPLSSLKSDEKRSVY